MASVQEHIENILTETTITEVQQDAATTLQNIRYEAVAALAILNFKPLDEDVPRD